MLYIENKYVEVMRKLEVILRLLVYVSVLRFFLLCKSPCVDEGHVRRILLVSDMIDFILLDIILVSYDFKIIPTSFLLIAFQFT